MKHFSLFVPNFSEANPFGIVRAFLLFGAPDRNDHHRWPMRSLILKPLILIVAILALGQRILAQVGAAVDVPTTTALTFSASGSSPYPAQTKVVLTATVTQNTGGGTVTSGLVKFCMAGAGLCVGPAIVGTAQLSPAGTASISLTPGAGVHSYVAMFTGIPKAAGNTLNYIASTSGSQSIEEQYKLPFTTTTTLASSGSIGNYTLTATVTTTGGFTQTFTPPTPIIFSPQLSGTVNFYDTFTDPANPNLLGPGTLANPPTGSRTFVNAAGSPIPLPSGLTRAYAIASGDFNGDGIPDLAVTSQTAAPGAITILLGHNDGTFTAAPKIAVGPQPVYLVVADFNGDGKQDIAVANQGSVFDGNAAARVVGIYLGQGDGTFLPGGSFTTPSQAPIYLATGDFNGDGIADLVVVDQQTAPNNNLSVYLGNGTGGFTRSSMYSVAGVLSSKQPSAVAVADFDGDGNLDVAVPVGTWITNLERQWRWNIDCRTSRKDYPSRWGQYPVSPSWQLQ